MNLDESSLYANLFYHFVTKNKICRKRRLEIEHNRYRANEETRLKKRMREEEEVNDELDYFIALASAQALLLTHKERKDRGPDRERDKRWWEDVYATGDDVIFRKTLRMKRETFNFILGEINHEVVKEPTNMKPLRDSLSTRYPICNFSCLFHYYNILMFTIF